MYRIILFGYLHERARWIKSCAVIGYPSGQDGAILPARYYSQENFLRKPYNISVIDQVCSVKMAWYRPFSFFACLWTSNPSRSINRQKKNLANIQASWPHTWSITHLYYMTVSHKDWELPNSRIWLAEIDIKRASRPVMICGEIRAN